MEFEKVYLTFWPKIYRLSLGYLNDVDLAKDNTQETFLIVWNQLNSFKGKSNIGTWIYRIAVNNCLKQIEKEKKNIKTNITIEHSTLESDEYNYQLDDNLKLLYKFIAELSELDRIIISLELEDIDQSEIAKIVGLKESNVRVKIHRIKEKLNKKFKEYEQ